MRWRMSRSPWNFSTAVPVSRLRGDERNGLLGGGGDGGLMELALDRGDELGEVGVADDAPELSLGFDHAGRRLGEWVARARRLGAQGAVMSRVLLDAAGGPRSRPTLAGFHASPTPQ